MIESISVAYTQLAVLLHRATGVGPQTVHAVIEYLKQNRIEPRVFRQNSEHILEKIGIQKSKIYSIKNVFSEYTTYSYWQWLQKHEIRVTMLGDDTYPASFTRLPQPPLLIYTKGVWPVTQKPALAVVGARRCTPYGLRATRQLVADCCAAGVGTIVSGLMYGIDAAAHQAAIAAKMSTIAVLGYGIGHWYPERMQALGQAVLNNNGTLLSEYPPGMSPTKGTFLERNRLIAALADAVLVPEAAERSGTQRTVAVAAELGIPVGAVPGPFDSLLSQGTKACVNQGALLVTSAQDILVELGLSQAVADQHSGASLHPIEALLQAGSQTTDELCLTTQLSVVQLSFELSSLELAGRIVRRGAQWYRL